MVRYRKPPESLTENKVEDRSLPPTLPLGRIRTGRFGEGGVIRPGREPFNVPDDLGDFMAAVARQESGGDYLYHSPDGTRFGAYGFPAERWPDLAAYAGIPDADPRDPVAQDRVAGATFAELYRRTVSWPLVATAWMAGMKAARYAARDGFQSETVRKLTASGESVYEYVAGVMGRMEAEPNLELPDRNLMLLAPGERPPAERRRERTATLGLQLLRATRGGRVGGDTAAAVAEARQAQEAQQPQPGVTPTPTTPGMGGETIPPPEDPGIAYE